MWKSLDMFCTFFSLIKEIDRTVRWLVYNGYKRTLSGKSFSPIFLLDHKSSYNAGANATNYAVVTCYTVAKLHCSLLYNT